jgi:hypothetical protein
MTSLEIEDQVRGMVERSARLAGERPRRDAGEVAREPGAAAEYETAAPLIRDIEVEQRGRGRLLIGAVSVVVVLVALAAFVTNRSAEQHVDATDGIGEQDEPEVGPTTSPVDAGAIDPMLLDYVAPTNGDAWMAARLRFDVGVARAKAATVAECVEARGFPGAESLRIDEARFWASGIVANLPALDRLAERGFTNPPLPVTPEYEAAFSCSEEDASAATRWQNRVQNLGMFSFEDLPSAIDATEAKPVWAEAVACMTEAGAPTDLLEKAAASEQRHIDEGGDPMGGHDFDVFLHEWVDSNNPTGHPDSPGYVVSAEAKAFTRCMTPFFAEVERALAGPRAEFVEQHRDELLVLQREYESFDVDGN